VNESAEGKAWFVKLQPSSADDETKGMMTLEAYKKHCDDAANHH